MFLLIRGIGRVCRLEAGQTPFDTSDMTVLFDYLMKEVGAIHQRDFFPEVVVMSLRVLEIRIGSILLIYVLDGYSR